MSHPIHRQTGCRIIPPKLRGRGATRLLLTIFAIYLTSALVGFAGVLTGYLGTSPAINRNLTLEGTLDWAIWGHTNGGMSQSLSPDVRKAFASGISDLTNISNGNPLRGMGQFGAFASTFKWTDGTPIASATGALAGLEHDGEQTPKASDVGEGFSLSVPAGTTPTLLTLYTTVHLGTSRLTASLSDNSSAPYIEDDDALNETNKPGIYTIRYQANSPGQALTVSFVLMQQSDFITNASNVAIQAATLSHELPSSLSVAENGTSGVLLSWNVSSNLFYQVQYSPVVPANAWEDLGPVLPGAEGINFYGDAVTNAIGFYRLLVLP